MVDGTVRPLINAMCMKKFLLLVALFISTLSCLAETWTPVGQVQWTEGALTGYSSDFNQNWNVSIERSDSRPSVFRFQPYSNKLLGNKFDNVYVYLHTEDQNAIYIEPYHYNYYLSSGGYNYYLHVYQRCLENGFDSKYYGRVVGNNTIEIPIGSFAVDSNSKSTQTAPSSNARYSTCVHKIVFPEGLLDYTPVEETWVNIGQGYWEDPFWHNTSGNILAGYVDMEKSVQNPNTYRIAPYTSDYIKIFAGDPSKVYISPYTMTSTDNAEITITQNCSENGINKSQYGTLNNGKIEIPGDYFTISLNETGESITGDPDRKCVIVLPEGFDNPLPEDNGVFMGIIGFNDEISRKPISLLDQDTKGDFTSFVDGLQMGNATLLYYAVDQSISALKAQTFPENLSNVVLLTFTDGLDQGSLAMKPEYRTSKGYADYLSNLIANTTVQWHPVEAYAIGLKSEDVYDDEMFMYNLQSLASDNANISSVSNIDEMQQKLTELFENLNKQTTQRVVTIEVPMMSHGDKYRFTLDHSSTAAETSNIWFEGEFNIDNMSLENIVYNGFTSTSGMTLAAKQEGIRLIFTLNDCRDANGNILGVDKNGIDQWQYIPSRGIWNHNKENAKEEDIDVQTIRSSVAIMFALDCSTSLGDLFPMVKSTANSFIERLAGGNVEAVIEDVVEVSEETIDINDPDVEIYNLQGMKVKSPTQGIYICRKGNITKKIVIK